MSMHLADHKGDFLIFASLARALGVPLTNDESVALTQCEISPGLYRRYPEIKVPEESRSDISRDGYLGVLLSILLGPEADRNRRLDDIINVCIKTRCQVGEVGEKGYTNIWPIFPLFLAARYGSWVPTLPLIAVPSFKVSYKGEEIESPSSQEGFRAHLMALMILIEYETGKVGTGSRWTMEKLVDKNPNNPWFIALDVLVHDRMMIRKLTTIRKAIENLPDGKLAGTGWGGCPNEVLKALAIHTMKRCV
jgi:hypothetical protein